MQVDSQSSSILNLLVQDLQKEDKFYHMEVHSDSTVEELKCLIAIESTIEPERQILTYKQIVLKDYNKKLVQHYGIQHNDMINLQITNLN
jgi:hypothetical protein